MFFKFTANNHGPISLSLLTAPIQRWISLLKEMILNFHFRIHLKGKIRRLYYIHFHKEYVRRQLLARAGDCRQCGICCHFLFRCPMLTRKHNCLIYGTCRPQSCKTFPIDHQDIGEVELRKGICGYNFPKTPTGN